MHPVILYSLFAIILILGFYLRAISPFRIKSAQDTWIHLLIVDEIKKHRGLPNNIPYFLFGKEEYDYPPVFHVILSIFPLKFLEKTWMYISPIIDMIQMIILFIFSFYFTKNAEISLLAAFIYAITPAILIECMSLNTRAIGSLSFSLTLIPIMLYSTSGNVYFLLLALFFGIVLLYTHKLSTQALYIFLIAFSIIEENIIYIVLGVSIFLGAFAVSRKWYSRILRGHIMILDFWRRHIHLYHTRKDMYTLFKTFDFKNKKLVFSTLKQFGKIVYLNPWILFIFVFLLTDNALNKDSLTNNLIIWIVIIYISFIAITYIPALHFIGDGERYLTYSVFPSSFVAARVITEHGSSIIYIGAIISLLISLAGIYQILKWYHDYGTTFSYTTGLRKIFDYIKNSEKQNIMCNPLGLSFMVSYFTRKKTLFHLSPMSFDEGTVIFPTQTKPLDYIINKYKIDFILSDSRSKDIDISEINNKRKVLSEGFYDLYEVKES